MNRRFLDEIDQSRSLGDIARLRQIVDQALAVDAANPDTVLAINVLINTSITLGDVLFANTYAAMYADLFPEDWSAHHLLGLVLYLSEDYEGSLAALLTAMRFSGENVEELNYFAVENAIVRAKFKLGNLNECDHYAQINLATLEQRVAGNEAIDVWLMDRYMILGDIQMELANFDNALGRYRQAALLISQNRRVMDSTNTLQKKIWKAAIRSQRLS